MSGDELGERAPPEVRLDAEHQDGVALETRNVRVVESVVRPIDASRASVDERHVRPRRLEVEEALRLDLRETRRRPRLREVTPGERRTLAAVVPAAERGDQNRVA